MGYIMVGAEYQEVSLEEHERKTRTWEYRFCFLPHKCIESGKWVWLTGAYRGHKTRRYDWQLVINFKWMCKEEFIKLRLLGLV